MYKISVINPSEEVNFEKAMDATYETARMSAGTFDEISVYFLSDSQGIYPENAMAKFDKDTTLKNKMNVRMVGIGQDYSFDSLQSMSLQF